MKSPIAVLSLLTVLGTFSVLTPQATAASTPTITMTASPNPVTAGQQVSFTVTVKGTPPTVPTGAITVYFAGSDYAFCTLDSSGACTATAFTRLNPASAQIYAQYAGDANYSFVRSAVTNLTIVAAPGLPATTTTLVSSANPSNAGESVTLTATVGGSGATGKVSFYLPDSRIPLVVPLGANGTATTTTYLVAPGTHVISANYSGDSAHQGSAGAIAQVVSPSSTSSPLSFVPVTPCRVADTRNAAGPFGGPALLPGAERNFPVPQSACGIPPNATAYSLNVTVIPQGPLNYLTVWSTGQPMPAVSLLNSDGRTKANAAIVPAGTSGAISVYSAGAATDLAVDINGYFVSSNSSALAFYPLTPCRVVDTRKAAGPLAGPYLTGGQARAFPLQSGSCNIPASAQAYSLNITAIPAGGLDYLTAWPTGQTQPTVSTVNAPTGAITANAAIIPAGTGGNISLFAPQSADVLVDVNGYFAPPGTGGLSLYTVPACRVLDTRTSAEPTFSGVLNVKVHDSACAPTRAASAYVLNATVVPTDPLSYLRLGPTGTTPTVSTLNASDGVITSNMAIVPTTNGAIDAFAPSPTALIVDLSAYFAP
jgi:Big-like domain-containing protein